MNGNRTTEFWFLCWSLCGLIYRQLKD